MLLALTTVTAVEVGSEGNQGDGRLSIRKNIGSRVPRDKLYL